MGQAKGNELLYPQKIGLEMTETYSFTVSDAAQMRTWQVQTPSNQIREGQPITTYRRDKIIIDAQGRVSEYENAEGDRNAFVYTTQANGKTHTAITSTVDGVQTGTMSYITNPNQGGVVEQTTTITGKRTCYTDYTEAVSYTHLTLPTTERV